MHPHKPTGPMEELPSAFFLLHHIFQQSQSYLGEVQHTGAASIGCTLFLQLTNTEHLLYTLWCAQHRGAAVGKKQLCLSSCHWR